MEKVWWHLLKHVKCLSLYRSYIFPPWSLKYIDSRKKSCKLIWRSKDAHIANFVLRVLRLKTKIQNKSFSWYKYSCILLSWLLEIYAWNFILTKCHSHNLNLKAFDNCSVRLKVIKNKIGQIGIMWETLFDMKYCKTLFNYRSKAHTIHFWRDHLTERQIERYRHFCGKI